MANAQVEVTGVPARCVNCDALVYLRVERAVPVSAGCLGMTSQRRPGLRWCDANGTAHECAA